MDIQQRVTSPTSMRVVVLVRSILTEKKKRKKKDKKRYIWTPQVNQGFIQGDCIYLFFLSFFSFKVKDHDVYSNIDFVFNACKWDVQDVPETKRRTPCTCYSAATAMVNFYGKQVTKNVGYATGILCGDLLSKSCLRSTCRDEKSTCSR